MLPEPNGERFEIVSLKSGSTSLRETGCGETFHPVIGPLAEARALHIEQQSLVDRAALTKRLVIWDVGLGAAANALAAIDALLPVNAEIVLHSFDRTTAPLQFAIENADALAYPRPHLDALRTLLRTGSVTLSKSGVIHWHLHQGDFCELVTEQSFDEPHAIFYDPYSSATNPGMWTLRHFRNLRAQLPGCELCLLTNYTRSTAVRVTLLLAGFFVGRGCRIGEKEETTIAATQLFALDHPLDHRWLERVQSSTNAAPLRENGAVPSPIDAADFAALLRHTQFGSNQERSLDRI